MAYDRYDRPRDERFGNDDRYRGRDDDRFRGGFDDGRERGSRDDGRSGGRGFFERAGDEISSWFGDEEAERRRVEDDRSGGHGRSHDDRRPERGGFFGGPDRGRGERERERGGWLGGHNDREQPRDERGGWFGRDPREQDRGRRDYGGQGSARPVEGEYRPFAGDYGRGSGERVARGAAAAAAGATLGGGNRNHDPHYAEWRQRQIDQLDRDYDDYRREHQSKFDNDFSGWRSQRQTKRQLLGQVREHMEVVGSDDQPVGKVDKVQDDKIILTRDSQGGVHKSLGCAAIDRVEGDRLILAQPAEEARRSLVEERGFQERSASDERGGFLARDRQQQETQQADGPHILERSFSGTYPDDAKR